MSIEKLNGEVTATISDSVYCPADTLGGVDN